jgi:hypothetical protein
MGSNSSDSWGKLIVAALLTAIRSVAGNQYFEKVRSDSEIRQETRKKQIAALENCRKTLERLNAPLIVIKSRGSEITDAELIYEVGQATAAMEHLYDDSLALDPALASAKKIAELDDFLTSSIEKQQSGGRTGNALFAQLCKTSIPNLIASTRETIQEDWQMQTHP